MPARALVAQAVSTTEVFPHCQFLWLASVLAHPTSHQPLTKHKWEMGEKTKTICKTCLLLSWSLRLHVPGPTWLSTEILLPGYVGDDEIASGSQTLCFESLSRWGWRQDPEGPGRQCWP